MIDFFGEINAISPMLMISYPTITNSVHSLPYQTPKRP